MDASSPALSEYADVGMEHLMVDDERYDIPGNRLPVEHGIYPDSVRAFAVAAERPFPHHMAGTARTPGDYRIDPAREICLIDVMIKFMEVVTLPFGCNRDFVRWLFAELLSLVANEFPEIWHRTSLVFQERNDLAEHVAARAGKHPVKTNVQNPSSYFRRQHAGRIIGQYEGDRSAKGPFQPAPEGTLRMVKKKVSLSVCRISLHVLSILIVSMERIMRLNSTRIY